MTDTLRRYNYSRQREVIYRILAGTKSHPTADWIFHEAKQQIPTLSLGTVYRNLQILRDQGVVREWSYGSGQARYDATVAPHHHFICEVCGAMEDVFLEMPVDLVAIGAQAIGQDVRDCRLEFVGRCAACAV